MEKISKKTILNQRKENSPQHQEHEKTIIKKDYTSRGTNDKIHTQESRNNRTKINNPVIQTKPSNKIYNYTEPEIHKKYSKQSIRTGNTPANKNIEGGYLDSDLEDPDNKIIYSNVVQRMKNNFGPIQTEKKNEIKGGVEKKQNYVKIDKNKAVNAVKNYAPLNIKNNNNNNQQSKYTNRSNYDKKYSRNLNEKNNNNGAGVVKKTNNRKEEEKSRTIVITQRNNIHKERRREDNKGEIRLRRQTVDRGGKYNNIQVTHIIYSKKNIDFHIVEPTQITDFKPKYSSNIGTTFFSRQNSTGKITHKSSVDGMQLTPKVKKPNVGKTTVYYHCSDIKQKKDSKASSNRGIYQTRNATNVDSIPRVKNYKTERKYDYTKPINDNKNLNNKQPTYNSKINTNKDKTIINNSKSGVILNTPVKTANNNYNNISINSKNSISSINNNRYTNYSRNISKNVKDEKNTPSNKTTNYKNLISPKNANKNKPSISYQNKENNKKDDSINIKNENSENSKNSSFEINRQLEENKKPKNLKTYVKTNDKNISDIKQIPKSEIKKGKEKIEVKPKENFEKMFLLRHYFKIYKNNVAKSKEEPGETEYEKWFKRNCDNNNDVSKKNITNKYLYFSPKFKNDKDLVEQMPYDEWFNRNCEKSENVIKNQKKENEKKILFNKLQNILDNEDKNNKKINQELNKLNNEEQKEILKDLRKSAINSVKKTKLDNLIDIYDKKQKEEQKLKLIKSAKDKDTKQLLEKLVNLWDNDNTLPKKEKEIKFENLNKSFRNNKKNELIDELNNLDKKDKNEAIDYLKLKNKTKKDEIDQINILSDKQKKIDALINILGGKSENKNDKKDKLKKIVDILLNLDKKTKNDFVNYMKNTAEEDEKKNEELLSIINELPEEEKEDYQNFDMDKNNYNYSYSFSTSYEKNLGSQSRKNSEDIREIKDSNQEKENILKNLINEDENNNIPLNDELIDLINEIQNTEEYPNKKLDEEEFKDLADNMKFHLYENNQNDGDNDFTENDEDIKIIIDSLNTLNKEDRIKTVDVLKKNADDNTKKKKFSKLQRTIKSILYTKKLIKNILDKEKEKEKKISDFTENILDELNSDTTIYMNNSDIDNNNNEINRNSNPSKIDEKIGNILNSIKSMELKEQKIIFEQLKNNAKSTRQKDLIRLLKTTKNINKMINFAKDTKIKLSKNKKKMSLKEHIVKQDEDSVENLSENELRGIIKDFENDLFKEKEKPLTRKEARENNQENNNKLKEISKVINSLSKNDQEEVLNKLKMKANNEFKKSQFDRLYKLIKNVNTIIDKLKENDDEFNFEEAKKELNKKELGEVVNNLKKHLEDNDLENNNDFFNEDEKNIEKQINFISHLDANQQNQIISSLQSSLAPEKQEKLKKLVKRLEHLNELKKLKNSLTNPVKSNPVEINKKIIVNEEEPEIELDENDLIKLIESINKNLFWDIDTDSIKYLSLSELDKYLIKKEKEKNIEETIKVMKKLEIETKEKIIGVLGNLITNNEQKKDLNKLKKKLDIDLEIEDIRNKLEDYNKEEEIEELKEEKLAELTNELAFDLFSENEEEKIDKLNKVANTIILLNIKDQEKIMDTLNNIAVNEDQKKDMKKLNNLVENLNYMNFYLYNVNLENIKKRDQDLNKEELSNLKSSVFSQLFNDENDINHSNKTNNANIEKMALKLSTLSSANRNEILNDLKKSNEIENNNLARKSLEKLKENLANYNATNIITHIIRKKAPDDSEIKNLADNINDILNKNRSHNNFTEQLLFNKLKEGKIDQYTKAVDQFDEESKRKTISYLSKNVLNDNHKNQINKLKDSIMNKKNQSNKDEKSNLLKSQFYMISALKNTELNDDEFNLLIETFCKDLFNDDIKDNNLKEDNINLIANIIKELNPESENKIIEILESKPEAKNKSDLIDNLRERILKLRVLKDELNEQKNDKLIDPNKSVAFNNSNEEDLLEEANENEEEEVTIEISVDDLNQEDLNDLCTVFNVEYADEKKNRNEEKEIKKSIKKSINPQLKKSVNKLASSIAKFNSKSQKALTEKIKENIKNEKDENQFKILMERIKLFENIKKIAKEIKQKNKEKQIKLEEKINEIKQLNDNGNKNLEKENYDKIEKEIINDLFDEGDNIEFDKDKDIKEYLIKVYTKEIIKNTAQKINALSISDKKMILNNLENLASDEKKKEKLNKLYALMESLDNINELSNKLIKSEKNPEFNINPAKDISQEKVKIMAEEYEKDIFNENPENVVKNNAIYLIGDKVKNLSDNNQEFIINQLKGKANDEEKKNRLSKLVNLLNKIKKLKKFRQKVLESHNSKKALEKIENEKKYGIVILNEKKYKSSSVIVRKPNELKEDKLKTISNLLLEDLKKINEEETNDISRNSIEKYHQEKENEKKLEEIADVINSLDGEDKNKIIDEIKNNFDVPSKKNNIYNRFMKVLIKRERQFDTEKIKKQKEAIKEISDIKKSSNTLLYSFIDEKNYNDSSDFVNLDKTADMEEIKDNKWTHRIGKWETEEIY